MQCLGPVVTFCISPLVISHIIRVYDLKSTCFLTCGICDMLHIAPLYYSKFFIKFINPRERRNVCQKCDKEL